MKHTMHQNTEETTLNYWSDLPVNDYFRFIDDLVIYKIIEKEEEKFHLDMDAGCFYTEDSRPIIKVELVRVERRVCIYRDKVDQNAEDE